MIYKHAISTIVPNDQLDLMSLTNKVTVTSQLPHANTADKPTKLLLVHVFSYASEADPDFIELVHATGGQIIECLVVKSRSFCAKHLISKGHLQTVKEAQQVCAIWWFSVML